MLYSFGLQGIYFIGGYVWGDKLDIGCMVLQYDLYMYEWVDMFLVLKGKNNLKNFQELSMVINNNVSVFQKGKYGSVCILLIYVYNKGQYLNQKLNKIIYLVLGDMKWKKFFFDGGLIYNKCFYFNDMGVGYGGSGFFYNLLVWLGVEYDICDYKNYWIKQDEQQNWMDIKWYDNFYFIVNEIVCLSDYDLINGYFFVNYDFIFWLNLLLCLGLDLYLQKKEWWNVVSVVGGWYK